MIYRILTFLLIATSALGQLSGTYNNVPNVQTVENFGQILSRVPVTNVIFAVRGKSSAGDWGDVRFARWDPTSTAATNSGTVFATTNGVGRWLVDWEDGDVRVFGAKPYIPEYTHLPWGAYGDITPIGTNDFSIWVRFKVPTFTTKPVGLFIISSTNNWQGTLQSTLELRADDDTFGYVFRHTNGSSAYGGTTTSEASALEPTLNPFTAFSGSVVDLVVTRRGTNASVYFNGTNVTSTWTFSNPAGWAKSIGLGDNLKVQMGNNNNGWLWPEPVHNLSIFRRELNSTEAASPSTATNAALALVAPSTKVPVDQAPFIQAAIDAMRARGGGKVVLPDGYYRTDTTIQMKARVSLSGQDAPDYPAGVFVSKIKGANLIPWIDSTHDIITASQSNAMQEPFLSYRTIGTWVTTETKPLQANIENLGFVGNLSSSSRGIYLDRVASVKIRHNVFSKVPSFAVLSYVPNAVFLNDNRGQLMRGIVLYGGTDLNVSDNLLDGPMGPALWLYSNQSQVVNNQIEYSNNPLGTGTFEGTFTVNPTTDIFTKTNHRLHTADVIRFANEGGALPSPLTKDINYFVTKISDNTFSVNPVYVDEGAATGALYGTKLDVADAGTGTNYVTVGPRYAFLNQGDGNTYTGNRSVANWHGAIRLEDSQRNTITANTFNQNFFNNSTDTNTIRPAIQLARSPNNIIHANAVDPRTSASYMNTGIELDGTSYYTSISGNSEGATTPVYGASGVLTYSTIISGTKGVFPFNTNASLYIPSTTSSPDPLAATPVQYPGASLIRYDTAADKLFLLESLSSNWTYTPYFNATGDVRWSGNATLATLQGVNNVQGSSANAIAINSTYVGNVIQVQGNSTTANNGPRYGFLRNGNTNSTIWGQVGANWQLGEFVFGGWWGSGSGDVNAGAASIESRSVTAFASGNAQSLLRFNVAPTNSTTRASALDLVMPTTTPQTSLRVYTAEAGSVQQVSRDTTSGVLYTGTLALPGVTDGDKGDITVSGSGATWNINANSVALATDTTGNYVAGITAGVGVAVSGSGSENATVTLAHNIEAGSNITLSTNGSALVITSTGGGGSTNGTPVSVDGATALARANFDDGGDINFTATGTNVTAVVKADSVALATDTTGNYVATIAGTANEVSVSGSGSENAATTLSLPSTIDLGGKTSFELPNGSAPVVDVLGEIASDNNAISTGRGAIVHYDGTATTVVVAVPATNLSLAQNGYVPVYRTNIGYMLEAQSGVGVTDGDKGDITVSGTGATYTIDADSVAMAVDTTGNFIATISAGNGISVTGSGVENASVTLAHNIQAGTNIVLTTNGSALVINSTASGGGGGSSGSSTGGYISNNVTSLSISNVTSAEELFSFTLPGGTLSADGEEIEIFVPLIYQVYTGQAATFDAQFNVNYGLGSETTIHFTEPNLTSFTSTSYGGFYRSRIKRVTSTTLSAITEFVIGVDSADKTNALLTLTRYAQDVALEDNWSSNVVFGIIWQPNEANINHRITRMGYTVKKIGGGGGNGYVIPWFTGSGSAPADGTTRYGSGWAIDLGTGYDDMKVQVPKTGTLKSVNYRCRSTGTTASSELVNHYIRVNGTTDIANAAFAYNAADTFGTASDVNVSLTAGDYIAFKLVAPTWATNPTALRWAITLYIE